MQFKLFNSLIHHHSYRHSYLNDGGLLSELVSPILCSLKRGGGRLKLLKSVDREHLSYRAAPHALGHLSVNLSLSQEACCNFGYLVVVDS